MKNSHSIVVSVGLFVKHDDAGGWAKAKDEDVWFQGVIDGSDVGAPGQYRWTDGAACPAAMAQLRKLQDVRMPKPILPIPVADEVDQGDIYVDGRVYTLDLESANVNGQAVGAVSFSTNLNTDLAHWADGMLAALQPCWSRSAPKDMDPFRGTLGDASYHQRYPRCTGPKCLLVRPLWPRRAIERPLRKGRPYLFLPENSSDPANPAYAARDRLLAG